MKKFLQVLVVAAVMVAPMSLQARTVLIDEGFENGIQDDVWSQEFAAGSTPWMVEDVAEGLSYPATVVQGSKRAYLRNNTGETKGYITRLVSKVMDLRPTRVYMPELTFWYANPRWGGDRDTLRVLYRNGTRSPWKQLAEYSTAAADWQRVKLELPEVGANYQIAFEGSDNLGRGIVLDSIKLQSAPECTVPSDLTVANKGAGKVNLAWVASWDASYFEVIVSKDTIDPNLIDLIEANTPEKIVFHSTVDGMQQNCDIELETGEYYLAYVRSICDDESSAWSSEGAKDEPFGFYVRIAKQVPFTEEFEGLSALADPTRIPEWTWTSNTGNPNPYINTKVTNQNTLANYSYNRTHAVIFSGGTTTSPSTFVPADRYVYMATPALADTTKENFHINQCQVHFWATVYTYTGRQYGRSIIVGVMDDPGDFTTFVPVDTVSVWGNKTFQENIVDLGSYSGNGAYLAFVSDFDRQNLIYIDDVTVDYRPAVNKVTKISVNPRDTYATISWEGNGSSYDVLITNAEVADPSHPDASVVVDQATVSTNSYRCEALEPNHSWNRPYYVYIQANGTEWSYRYPFVTIAPQREIPYTFDMEASTTTIYQITSDPNKYATGLGIFGNGGTYPAMETNANNSYAGSGYLYLNKRGGTDAWVTLPMVENLEQVQVKFYLSGASTYDQAHATVGVMSNPMDVNSFVPVSSFSLNATGYTRCYANFENYSGPDGVIAILWDDVANMSKNTINYIDQITVEELSDCVPPTNIALDITYDSITVGWETSLSDEWEFFLSRTALTSSQRIHKTKEEIAALGGVVVAETLTWSDPTANPQFGFGNLTPNTKYYLYVRATCDPEWWTEMALSTPCKDEEFPYKETFESYNIGSTNLGCWQLADYLGVGYPSIYQAGSSSASNKALELYSSGTTHRSVAILPRVEGELSNMLLSFDARPVSSSSYSSSSSIGVVYIGSMGDIADQSSFVPFDTIMVSGSSFTTIRRILSNYPLAYDNIAISSGLGSLQSSSDILIDNVELKDPSCIEAYDFHQTSSDPDAFDLEWSGASPSNRWEVKVLNTSVSLASIRNGSYNPSYEIVGDSILTGTSLHVGGLEMLHTYYVYVRTLCGDSVWATTTVHTSCGLLDPSKPNKETFDDSSTLECWTFGKLLSSDSYPSITTESGNNILGILNSNSTGSGVWAASPKIKCDSLTSVMVSFSLSTYSSSEYAVFGVMTDPEDITTFVPLDSMAGSGRSNMRTYTYDLSNYYSVIPASAKYVAWHGRIGRYDWVYLDDVSFVSVACPLTKPTVSSLTTSSARISSGLRTSDSWILMVTDKAVSESDLYNDGYIAPADRLIFYDTISASSQSITGLKGQTRYYVYTMTLCEDDAHSQWTTSYFMTPCQAMTPEALGTITFAEEDGFTPGTTGEIPCWTVGSKTASATGSYIPYVVDGSSTGHDGFNYLRFTDAVTGTDASATSYTGSYAIMPELDIDTISKYQVSFWARGNSGANKLIIGIVTNTTNMNTFMAVDTINLDKSEWNPYVVGFENYWGDYMGNMGKNIVFLSDFGASNEAYISEVSVELIPKCRPVGSFNVDSVGESHAVISWKGYQDSYRLLVADKALRDSEKAGYHYLLDTIVDHSEYFRLEGLQAITNYYVYAQGICEEGDSTAISTTYAAVRTTCPTLVGVPLPFFDDFESYEIDDSSPGCWQLLYTGSRSTYFAVKEVSGNGTKAVDVYSSSNNAYMVVPKVDGNLENLNLSFDARSWGGSSAAKMYVGVMDDVNDVTTFVLLKEFNLAGTSAFTHCSMDLADYELPYDNLVITAGISNITPNRYDVYLDNVSLTRLASCNTPRVSLTSLSADGTELILTPAERTDSLWQVVVIPDETASGMGAAALAEYIEAADKITVDSTHVVISNLQPATSYIVYARTICSAEDMSAWSRTPLKFTTRFYYANSYFFGFEKEGQPWERAVNSGSDKYYIHPALEAGKDSLGASSDAYTYYPYSQEDENDNYYARTGTGALTMRADGRYHGGYIIFPAIGEAQDRAFEFKARTGYLVAYGSRKLPEASAPAQLEIGTIEKDKGYETYQSLATLHLDGLNAGSAATSRNNYHYSTYTIDMSAAAMASRQLVLHLPKQSSDSVYMTIDDVTLDAPKGFSLVSLSKISAESTTALVEWHNIGGPWKLTIKDEAGTTVATYPNLENVTSQLVEGLEQQTNYIATLEAATSHSGYVTTDKLAFRTLCLPMEPDGQTKSFTWNFDDSDELEANDILAGDGNDAFYLKPACFHVGITYDVAVNGYQWLVEPKGFAATGSLTPTTTPYEVGRNDSYAMRVHTTEDNYGSYLVLPALNCNLDTMMIDFYGRCFVNYDRSATLASQRNRIADATYLGAGYSRSIVVGTLTDPMDFSTLQVLDTLTYSQTELTTNDNVEDDPAGLRYWEQMRMPLTGAQGRYIVLFQPAPGLFYLDDLSIAPIGNTLFAPTSTRTSDITQTSATLSWNTRHPQLETVVVLLNPLGEEIFRDTTVGTTYPLSNLEAAMEYQWYVYQIEGTETSPSSKPEHFNTECTRLSASYSSGFEAIEGTENIGGRVGYRQMLCWTYSDAARGEWVSATYDPYNQANTSDVNYSYSGSSALMMRASYSARGTSYQPYVALPAMDINAYDTLQISFWMRPAYVSASSDSVLMSYTGSTYSKSIIVGTMTDPTDAATFVPIDTVTYDGTLSTANKATAANNYLYQQMKVELAGATGPYVALMTSFYEKGGTSQKANDYLWIDEVAFERKQECKEPKELEAILVGSTHADLAWDGPAVAQSYRLQVSTDAYFDDERMAFDDIVKTNSVRVEGLQPLTTYVWRVQAICSDEWGESSYSQKATFTTSRSPYFLEPFSATVSANEWLSSKAHAENVVDSTGTLPRGTDNWSFIRTTNNYGLTGSHYVASGYSGDYHWLVTPNFYLPEGDSVHLSMDIALTACNSAHTPTGNAVTENDMKDDYYFMIIVSDDGGATWKSQNILAKWQNTNPEGMQLRDIPATGKSIRYSLASYAGKNVRIGLYREAVTMSNTGIAIHVDNLRLAYFKKEVDYTSACQYEDVQVEDIYLSGDDTEPGIHAYPTCFYATDAEARAGKKDSVFSLEIEVFPTQTYAYTDTICEGDSYSDMNFTAKDRPGTYRRKLQTVEHGCDSIVTLYLAMKERRYGDDTEATICKGESFEWHGQIYNRAGIYRDTTVSSIGCDSIETLILQYVSDQTVDSIYVVDSVEISELPFVYDNPLMPYAPGQAPITYPAGTPEGVYTDIIRVQGSTCEAIVVHTLVVYNRHEGIEDVEAETSRPQKIIYDNKMYILLNDEWYTPTGQKVSDPRL